MREEDPPGAVKSKMNWRSWGQILSWTIELDCQSIEINCVFLPGVLYRFRRREDVVQDTLSRSRMTACPSILSSHIIFLSPTIADGTGDTNSFGDTSFGLSDSVEQ